MEKQQSAISSKPEISSLYSVGELLNRAWQIYKTKIKVILGIMAIPLFFILILTFISFIPLLSGLFLSSKLRSVLPFLGLITIVLILGLLSYIIPTWSQLALIYITKERDKEIGVKESLIRVKNKIIPSLWLSILYGLIIIVGLILLIIPGIVFSVWYFFAIYILVSEDLRGRKALSRSKELVSGNFGKVLWRLLIGMIIAVAGNYLFDFLIINILQAPSFLKDIFTWAIFPFLIIYYFLLYENLKSLKEGNLTKRINLSS